MQDENPAIPGEGATRHDHMPSRPLLARRMTSMDLFAGSREVEIEHNGRHYRLRITQTGKLILTA